MKARQHDLWSLREDIGSLAQKFKKSRLGEKHKVEEAENKYAGWDKLIVATDHQKKMSQLRRALPSAFDPRPSAPNRLRVQIHAQRATKNYRHVPGRLERLELLERLERPYYREG